MGIFVQKWYPIFPFSFLSILRRKLFGGFREKTHEPHHLFSFLPTQPNILKKVFLPIFSSKFFIHLISPLNKHTFRVFILFYFIFELSFCIIFFILSLFIIKVHVFHLLFKKKLNSFPNILFLFIKKNIYTAKKN